MLYAAAYRTACLSATLKLYEAATISFYWLHLTYFVTAAGFLIKSENSNCAFLMKLFKAMEIYLYVKAYPLFL